MDPALTRQTIGELVDPWTAQVPDSVEHIKQCETAGTLQPDEFFIEYPDKIIVVAVQNGHSAASHFGSLLRFRRDISTTVFPEYIAKCLPGTLARHLQQTAFAN